MDRRRRTEQFAPGEFVELIFAEQEEYQGRAKTIYGAYMKGKPLAPIQSLRFASMKACAPLQAADMAVYCTNKQMEKNLYAKKTKEEIYRSALDVLYWNRGFFMGEDHDTLTRLFLEIPVTSLERRPLGRLQKRRLNQAWHRLPRFSVDLPCRCFLARKSADLQSSASRFLFNASSFLRSTGPHGPLSVCFNSGECFSASSCTPV